MEGLIVYSYFWALGVCSEKEYNLHLDEEFLKSPDNELLSELEWCSHNCKNTFVKLSNYFEKEEEKIDLTVFGKKLFEGLERIYRSKGFSLSEFGKVCYKLWNLLPQNIMYDEPFFTLCYADDLLPWGDERRTEELYEKAFDFYKNKEQ